MTETKIEAVKRKVKMIERQWFTYPEASAYSGLGRTTLTALVTSGEIPAAKVGKAVRISRSGLSEYMKRSAYVGSDQKQ